MEEASAQTLEVHFTDGFFQDDMTVLLDGAELAHLTLTTRMQTGLADILTLHIDSGKEVTLRCVNKSLEAAFTVDAATPFVGVSLRDDNFELTMSDQQPGYL